MNVAGNKTAYAPHVERISQQFDGRVIAISVRDDANFILFAFKDPAFEPRWKWLTAGAAELRNRFGLDFHQFARQLERGHRQRLARRIAV
jgi:spermidine synthase